MGAAGVLEIMRRLHFAAWMLDCGTLGAVSIAIRQTALTLESQREIQTLVSVSRAGGLRGRERLRRGDCPAAGRLHGPSVPAGFVKAARLSPDRYFAR